LKNYREGEEHIFKNSLITSVGDKSNTSKNIHNCLNKSEQHQAISQHINNITMNMVANETSEPEKMETNENDIENVLIDDDDPFLKPEVPFNQNAVPKSFDIFMNDLQNSSTDLLTKKKPTGTNMYRGISMKVMTSSIDKDLNKDTVLTSKIDFNSNATFNKPQMNKTIELDNNRISLAARSCSMNNLNENPSQIVHGPNFKFDDDDDAPRTVFNTTYTSWLPSDKQLEIEALNQEMLFKENNLFNQTQDINMSDNELNKTKDIVVLNRTVSLSSVASSITNDNEKLLNRTRDITEEEGKKKSKKRLSVLSRPQISQESVKNTTTSSSTSKLTKPKQSIVQNASNIPAKPLLPPKTTLPTQKSSPIQTKLQLPITNNTKNLHTNHEVNSNRLSSSSNSSTSSSSSSKENKKQPISTNPSNSNITSASIAKNPSNYLTTKPPEYKPLVNKLKPPSAIQKPTTLTQNGQTKPSIITNHSSITSNLIASQQNQVNSMQNINTNSNETGAIQKKQLKPPSQIPSFKSAIPTFRNATNNQIKVKFCA